MWSAAYHPVDPFQSGVDQPVAEIGVQQGESDRRLGHQLLRDGQAALHVVQRALVDGDPQRVHVPQVVLQPYVAELHPPRPAVAVPDGEGPGPVLSGRHHGGEQLGRPVPVLLAEQQPGGVPAQRLLGGEPEGVGGLWAPEHDPALDVHHDRGDVQEVQQAARPARYRSVVAPGSLAAPRRPGCVGNPCRAVAGPGRAGIGGLVRCAVDHRTLPPRPEPAGARSAVGSALPSMLRPLRVSGHPVAHGFRHRGRPRSCPGGGAPAFAGVRAAVSGRPCAAPPGRVAAAPDAAGGNRVRRPGAAPSARTPAARPAHRRRPCRRGRCRGGRPRSAGPPR